MYVEFNHSISGILIAMWNFEIVYMENLNKIRGYSIHGKVVGARREYIFFAFMRAHLCLFADPMSYF